MKTIRLLLAALFSATLFSAFLPTHAETGSPSVRLSPCAVEIGLGQAKQNIDALCGVLGVPEDRSNPAGRQIEIHFAVLESENPDTELAPIFHLEGGPGASAIGNFTLWNTGYHALRKNHDIVLIDQRGTGKSASLQCTEITSESIADLKAELTLEAETDQMVDRLRACLNRLARTNDPQFYTSRELADDTDAIREALGYEKINVFGNSYGTWLAQIYLRRHAEHINTVILDSVTGPWNFPLLDAASNAEDALLRLFDLCVEDEACNARYPDLRARFERALDQLAARPANTAGQSSFTGGAIPVIITRDRFLEAVRTMLYQSAYYGALPQVVAQAADGNYTLPAAVLVGAAEQADDLSLGMFLSVHCSESLPFYTDAVLSQYKEDAFFGSSTGSANVYRAWCGVWRAAELSADEVAPVKSDLPVLILGGAYDPITPVKFAEETRERFPNSVLAVFPFQGHGLLPASKCAQNIVAEFLRTGSADTGCTESDVRPIFSGTYRVKLVPYSDPASPVRLNLPDGWMLDAEASDSAMTYFRAPDLPQILGVAAFRARSLDEAQARAIESIEAHFGKVDIQITLDVFGSRIVQHSMDGSDYFYTGAITIVGIGGEFRVMWYAAPNNVFIATFEPLVPILLSITPN